MLMLRYITWAISLLDLPCVMSARTSASRSVRPSVRPGQSSPDRRSRPRRSVADDDLPVSDRFDGSHELVRRERLGEVAAGTLGHRAVDEFRMEVPGVDHDMAGVRVVDEDGDVVMVGFGLGEGVVEHDVDVIGHGPVGVHLGDDDPIAVRVEQVGQPDHDDVVVVDKRHPNRHRLTSHPPDRNHPSGCTQPPEQVVGWIVIRHWSDLRRDIRA